MTGALALLSGLAQEWPDKWATPPETRVAAFSALFCVVATAVAVMVAVDRRRRGIRLGSALVLLSLMWGFTAKTASRIDGFTRPAPLLAAAFALLCAVAGVWVLRNACRRD